MTILNDFAAQGRHRADKGFKVYTRKQATIGTVVLMPTPIRSPSDREYVVEERFEYRWDLLADALLGNVALRWVLMRHNRISNPFIGPAAGDRLLVPTNDQIRYYLAENQ